MHWNPGLMATHRHHGPNRRNATRPGPHPESTAFVPRRRAKTRRDRQIIVMGNCEMQAMAGLYNCFVAERSGDVVQHVWKAARSSSSG
jgi:hypothetical protein